MTFLELGTESFKEWKERKESPANTTAPLGTNPDDFTLYIAHLTRKYFESASFETKDPGNNSIYAKYVVSADGNVSPALMVDVESVNATPRSIPTRLKELLAKTPARASGFSKFIRKTIDQDFTELQTGKDAKLVPTDCFYVIAVSQSFANEASHWLVIFAKGAQYLTRDRRTDLRHMTYLAHNWDLLKELSEASTSTTFGIKVLTSVLTIQQRNIAFYESLSRSNEPIFLSKHNNIQFLNEPTKNLQQTAEFLGVSGVYNQPVHPQTVQYSSHPSTTLIQRTSISKDNAILASERQQTFGVRFGTLEETQFDENITLHRIRTNENDDTRTGELSRKLLSARTEEKLKRLLQYVHDFILATLETNAERDVKSYLAILVADHDEANSLRRQDLFHEMRLIPVPVISAYEHSKGNAAGNGTQSISPLLAASSNISETATLRDFFTQINIEPRSGLIRKCFNQKSYEIYPLQPPSAIQRLAQIDKDEAGYWIALNQDIQGQRLDGKIEGVSSSNELTGQSGRIDWGSLSADSDHEAAVFELNLPLVGTVAGFSAESSSSTQDIVGVLNFQINRWDITHESKSLLFQFAANIFASSDTIDAVRLGDIASTWLESYRTRCQRAWQECFDQLDSRLNTLLARYRTDLSAEFEQSRQNVFEERSQDIFAYLEALPPFEVVYVVPITEDHIVLRCTLSRSRFIKDEPEIKLHQKLSVQTNDVISGPENSRLLIRMGRIELSLTSKEHNAFSDLAIESGTAFIKGISTSVQEVELIRRTYFLGQDARTQRASLNRLLHDDGRSMDSAVRDVRLLLSEMKAEGTFPQSTLDRLEQTSKFISYHKLNLVSQLSSTTFKYLIKKSPIPVLDRFVNQEHLRAAVRRLLRDDQQVKYEYESSSVFMPIDPSTEHHLYSILYNLERNYRYLKDLELSDLPIFIDFEDNSDVRQGTIRTTRLRVTFLVSAQSRQHVRKAFDTKGHSGRESGYFHIQFNISRLGSNSEPSLTFSDEAGFVYPARFDAYADELADKCLAQISFEIVGQEIRPKRWPDFSKDLSLPTKFRTMVENGSVRVENRRSVDEGLEAKWFPFLLKVFPEVQQSMNENFLLSHQPESINQRSVLLFERLGTNSPLLGSADLGYFEYTSTTGSPDFPRLFEMWENSGKLDEVAELAREVFEFRVLVCDGRLEDDPDLYPIWLLKRVLLFPGTPGEFLKRYQFAENTFDVLFYHRNELPEGFIVAKRQIMHSDAEDQRSHHQSDDDFKDSQIRWSVLHAILERRLKLELVGTIFELLS